MTAARPVAENRHMRLLAVAACLFALAVTAVSAAPPGRPSHAPASGPPPAWIHTGAGDRWLGWSSYCWPGGKRAVCADYLRPSCGGRFPSPRVPVRIGELATLHFGFVPRGPSVSEGGRSVAIRSFASTILVRVRRLGVLEASVRRAGSPGGDALYVACLVRRSS